MTHLFSVLGLAMLTGAALTAASAGASIPPVNPDPPGGRSNRPVFLVLFSEDSSQPSTQLMEAGLTEGTSTTGIENAPILKFEYLEATRYRRPRVRQHVSTVLAG